MTKPLLRILLLEDNDTDAALVQDLLEADGLRCEVVRVQTRAEFVSALEDRQLDLILADYSLPSFDGVSALKLTSGSRPDLPFIFVSGTLGEEVAIEALKIGATDYVLKTKLSRLLPSVQRALRESEGRAERRKAEQALRRSEAYLTEAQRLSHTGSFGWDVASGEIYWSDETFRIFECDPATTPTVQTVLDRAHPDDRENVRQTIERAAIEKTDFAHDYRVLAPDGSVKHVRVLARRTTAEDTDNVVFVGAVSNAVPCRAWFGSVLLPIEEMPTIIVTSPGFQVNLCPRARIQVRMNGARQAPTSRRSSVEKTCHALADSPGCTAQSRGGLSPQTSAEFGLSPFVVNQGSHRTPAARARRPFP